MPGREGTARAWILRYRSRCKGASGIVVRLCRQLCWSRAASSPDESSAGGDGEGLFDVSGVMPAVPRVHRERLVEGDPAPLGMDVGSRELLVAQVAQEGEPPAMERL